MIPHNHNRKQRRPRMVAVRNKQPHGELYRTDLLVVFDCLLDQTVRGKIKLRRPVVRWITVNVWSWDEKKRLRIYNPTRGNILRALQLFRKTRKETFIWPDKT
jgi:hypothetical protein